MRGFHPRTNYDSSATLAAPVKNVLASHWFAMTANRGARTMNNHSILPNAGSGSRTGYWFAALLLFLIPAATAADAAQLEPGVSPSMTAGMVAKNAKNYELAYANFQPLADSGNSEAQRQLGILYRQGWGVTIDKARAVALFFQSAQSGNSDAELDLGRAYLRGDGVEKNAATAASWYYKATTADNVEAEAELGTLYATGQGVEKDFYTALTLFARAGQQGYAAALHNIAIAYSRGDGVEKNPGKALFWLLVALQRATPFERQAWSPALRPYTGLVSPADAVKISAITLKWAPSAETLKPVIADAAAFRDGKPAPNSDLNPAPGNGI